MNVFMRRDWIMLLGLALLVNVGVAYVTVRPSYMDAYYYFNGAVQLARGAGFTEPYVWNYLTPTGLIDLSREAMPSHLYWMPLPSLLAAPWVWLGDPSVSPSDTLFRYAQIPFVIIAALLPLLAYQVAFQLTGVRRHALASALLTLFSPFYFGFWGYTDGFALYGLLAGGALALGSVAGERRAYLFGAGVLVGLAQLTRADGSLVLGILFLINLYQKRTKSLLPLGLGYLVVMSPWFIRNLLVVGAPLAPGGTRTLWLTTYDDIFIFPAEALTLERYLALGWGAIFNGKWAVLTTNLQSLVSVTGAIMAFPFMLIGLWQLRRQPMVQAALLYGASLLTAMSLFFTFPGERGGFFHSSTALLPFVYPAAVVGLEVSVDGIARMLKHWQPEKSKPVFTTLLVLGAMGLAGFLFQARFIGPNWRQPRFAQLTEVYPHIGAWLQTQATPALRVLVNNPPGFYYFTGYTSFVIPNGDATMLKAAQQATQARWLILDANHPAGLAALYTAPDQNPQLTLRATFTDTSQRPVYLLEWRP